VALRRMDGVDSARALADLLVGSGDWKRVFPGFVAAASHISDDGRLYVNYPQWVSETAYDAYMADPRNAGGQGAIAALEDGPPEFLMCTVVAQIEPHAPHTAYPSPASDEGEDTMTETATGERAAESPSADEAFAGEAAIAALWERNYDPRTTAIISALPVEPTWRCLDLGAGAGSMSAWLAERIPRGTVLALDVDTRMLDASRTPNLTVRRADAADVEFAPGSFDLILARALFQYLPDPEAALRRAIDWLAPGGWLVAEDFYFLPSEDAPTPAGQALVAAYIKGLNASGADMRWARRLPSTMAGAGLVSVGAEVTPLGPGQHADDNELMRLRMTLHGHELVEAGLVTAAHLADFIAGIDDPTARDITTLQFSVWGRKAD
jgi:SAM-dependent methyltransferase